MIVPLPKQRRGTYNFLRFAKKFDTIHLSIEVDATLLKEHRIQRYNETGNKISYTTYMIHIVSQVLKKYPEVNVSVKHSLFPKLIRHSVISAKFTLDKQLAEERIVLSGVVHESDKKSLEEIQEVISKYKNSDYHRDALYKNSRLLSSVPIILGTFLYKKVMNNLHKREQIQGTFMVSSLGHNGVHSFFPMSSSTICFGLGGISDKPVVMNNEIVIRPIFNLNMSFDHAAIDGAVAADFLKEVKETIETIK
jgi:pyruvate/2-oxoglutarate dehydrogenase complex dihydrolipoamide acyltransferase (E2) component